MLGEGAGVASGEGDGAAGEGELSSFGVTVGSESTEPSSEFCSAPIALSRLSPASVFSRVAVAVVLTDVVLAFDKMLLIALSADSVISVAVSTEAVAVAEVLLGEDASAVAEVFAVEAATGAAAEVFPVEAATGAVAEVFSVEAATGAGAESLSASAATPASNPDVEEVEESTTAGAVVLPTKGTSLS